MLRRVASVTFAAAVALAAGCGHQVTPEPNLNSNLSGHMLVRLRTSAPLDFNDFTYMIAIDVCGTGVPYPQAAFTGYNSYSYSFLVGAGFNTALPELFEYYVNPNSSGSITYLPVNDLDPSTTQFNPNDNGQGNEFDLVFLRADLNNPLNLAKPCPNSTTAPSPSPSSPAPVQGLSSWTFNMITFQNRIPQDSLGNGGATDVTFPGLVVDTTTTNTQTYYKPGGVTVPANPAAQLIYGEVDNYL
jgi:hypothetical protein